MYQINLISISFIDHYRWKLNNDQNLSDGTGSLIQFLIILQLFYNYRGFNFRNQLDGNE